MPTPRMLPLDCADFDCANQRERYEAADDRSVCDGNVDISSAKPFLPGCVSRLSVMMVRRLPGLHKHRWEANLTATEMVTYMKVSPIRLVGGYCYCILCLTRGAGSCQGMLVARHLQM